MWIVRLALRRPYTIAVLCLGIALFGALSLWRSRVDVLPSVDIPVVVVVWSYPGLVPEEMERRVIYLTERALSTTISDIERIDSQSINGIGLVKIYFQPNTEIASAVAQVGTVCNTILRLMPPGMTAPTILQFNASNVPVAQLTLSGQGVGEQELFDYGLNFLRIRLFTVPGLATPAPFGGRSKQVMVDLDPARLAATGLSPQDVVNALTASNVILPAGSARLGRSEFDVELNASPLDVKQFDQMPVKEVNGQLVRMGDVAHVHQGFAVQTNVVHVDGERSTYLAVLRKAGSSTLAVVDSVREMLPALRRAAPEGIELKIDFDQSQFVRASVREVLREALLAGALVSLMILFFLGSWRGMVIVSSSIPIAILVSVIGLFLAGETLNLMTLGGLALAIGMLVDDATVEIENIHRNSTIPGPDGRPRHLTAVVLDSARQVAVPALAATLTICIVFFPVVLLTGPARFLFRPLALAVVLAMLASYLLSRTLVPTLARLLMEREHAERSGAGGPEQAGRLARLASRWNAVRDRGFARLQGAYAAALATVLARRGWVALAAALLLVAGVSLARVVGLDFFPAVDTGQLRLHYRAPPGTRIEVTEAQVMDVERAIRAEAGGDVESIVDNIGVPISYNLAFVQSSNAGGEDAEIRISLRPGHRPSQALADRLRQALPARFPGAEIWFEPADVVSQVLSFGLPAQLEAEVVGRDPVAALATARQVIAAARRIPGATDAHLAQVFGRPSLAVDVDRQQAFALGLTERDVATSVLTSLSSSSLAAPSFWVDPRTGVNYIVAVQTPIERIQSAGDLLSTPLSPASAGGGASGGGALAAATSPSSGGASGLPLLPGGATSPYLGAISSVTSRTSRTAIAHDTVQPVVEVQLAASGRDLGAVASDLQRALDAVRPPPGVSVKLRGQSESMFSAFGRLGLGLVLAIALVYLLLVVLFQSWADPLIIIAAVPGALVGILWMLAATGTTLNVESFMGAIMAVGIATSNGILLVSFANDARAGAERDPGPTAAVLEAARTRLRPVLMTALAMILGMLPMAIGLGEGAEQNAPLGRAVIGGLLAATVSTLFLVPVAYTWLRRRAPRKHELDVQFAAEAGEAPPSRGAPAPAEG